MVKKLLCMLITVAMILSVSLSAVASSDTVQLMTEAEETQSIEIPDVVSEGEVTDESQLKTMEIESPAPVLRGTFTLTEKHYLERNTGLTTFNAWKPDNFTDVISGRVYNNSGDPRDEAILRFETTATGLNDDDKIILSFAARAQAALGVGATVRIVGVADENYTFNTTLPTVDKNHTFTTTDTLTLDFKKFSFDVTSYVKARLLAGITKISFLVELVDSDWKTGDSSVYMDLALAPYNIVPTLSYEDTSLTSLTYDGKDIKLVEGQKTYTVTVDDDAMPLVEAEALNSTIDIVQAASIPGTAVVNVDTYGTKTQYKVNFITSDYIGTATASAAYYATRSTAHGRFDANLTAANMSSASTSVQVRTDSSTKIRQEGSVTFNVNDLLGITNGQKATLTIYGSGNAAAVSAGTKLEIRGVTGENVAAGGKYGTDPSFTVKSSNSLSTDTFTAYTFNVTDYVNSKIKAGETTVTFAIRVEEGGNGTTCYWYCGGERTPKLTVEEISTELSDIKVDGVSVADFSSSRTSYTHYIADDYVGIPTITVVKKDSGSNEYIEVPELIPGTAIVEITNPAGKSTTYEIKLRYESSKTNPTTYTKTPYVTYKDAATGDTLSSLTAGGKIKAELNLKNLKDESDVTFVTALYNDGFLVAKKSIKKTGSETALVNTLDINLTDVSKATVKSFILNGYGDGKNIVNCAQLNSSNNLIKSVTISGVDFYEFDTNVFDYTLNVPASVLNYPEFNVTAQDSGAKLETIVPVYLSGAVKLKATAGNGEEKTYTVNIKRANEEITNVTMDYEKLDGISKKMTVFKNIQNPIYSPAPSKPFVEGTSTGAEFNKEYALANCQNPVNYLTDRSNIWIGSMDNRFEGAYMIGLPFDGINPTNNPKMKDYTTKTGFIEFDINRSATVYVLHSGTSMPSWASAEGFKNVTDLSNCITFISNTDGSVSTSKMNYAYSKYYSVPEWSEEPVTVSLGGIANHNYWWIIVVFDK